LLAMKRAAEIVYGKYLSHVQNEGRAAGLISGHLLIDGIFKIPGLQCEQTCIIKGDLRAAPISAAAIVAKVERDELMAKFATRYPQYGFEKHKGYSTPAHKKLVELHGPCEHHRRSFAGVKEHL
jgi:ribonuclease HII